jgi:hypothetical protein
VAKAGARGTPVVAADFSEAGCEGAGTGGAFSTGA